MLPEIPNNMLALGIYADDLAHNSMVFCIDINGSLWKLSVDQKVSPEMSCAREIQRRIGLSEQEVSVLFSDWKNGFPEIKDEWD